MNRFWPYKLAAVAAAIAGLLMIIGGIGHLIAVTSVAISQDKRYDFRLVALLATGGILLYPGVVNLAVSRWIWRGRQWAFGVSALGTIPLLVYMVLLIFIKTAPDPTDPFAGAGDSVRHVIAINGIYLGLLVGAWIWLRKQTRTSRPKASENETARSAP